MDARLSIQQCLARSFMLLDGRQRWIENLVDGGQVHQHAVDWPTKKKLFIAVDVNQLGFEPVRCEEVEQDKRQVVTVTAARLDNASDVARRPSFRTPVYRDDGKALCELLKQQPWILGRTDSKDSDLVQAPAVTSSRLMVAAVLKDSDLRITQWSMKAPYWIKSWFSSGETDASDEADDRYNFFHHNWPSGNAKFFTKLLPSSNPQNFGGLEAKHLALAIARTPY